ncbi:MAG: YciI family protein [Myxococcota bacterium]|nr:YciI family protein [Myxococcota bacterium]
MQYIVLIYGDEEKWSKVTPEQMAKVMDEYREFTQGIVKSGHFRAGARLQSTSSATTLRERSGRRLMTDGPFAEAKEYLGGYYLLECEHLDEAIEIAGRIPGLRFGDALEIRPVMPQAEAPRKAP